VKPALLVGAAILAAACAARHQVAADLAPAPVRPVSSSGTPSVRTQGSGSTTVVAIPIEANSSDDANTVDPNLVKRGYRVVQRKGLLLYCQTQTVTGTHFSNTVCLTHAQVLARDRETRETKDQLDRAGHQPCPKGSCD
jgi:hypothetical protein